MNLDRAHRFAPFQMASTFVDSWKVPSEDSAQCNDGQQNDAMELECKPDTRTKAEAVCDKLVSSSKFTECLKIFSKDALLETCISDYCYCRYNNNPEKCVCDGIAVFAKDCQFRGVLLSQGWRDMEICREFGKEFPKDHSLIIIRF